MDPTEEELDAAWRAEQLAKAHPLSDDAMRRLVDLFDVVEQHESGAA